METCNTTTFAQIPLRDSKNDIVGWAKCSTEDHAELNNYEWHMNEIGYAEAEVSGRMCVMHRLVLKQATCIDHVNGERTDNQRTNLRNVNPTKRKQ